MFLFDAHAHSTSGRSGKPSIRLPNVCSKPDDGESFQALAKKDGTVAAINNAKRFGMATCLETDDPRLNSAK